MKKAFCLLLSSIALCWGAVAQQITRFGVVDTAKVYSAYFKNSAAVRNYEKKKSEAQEEINKRTEELRALKAKRLEISGGMQSGGEAWDEREGADDESGIMSEGRSTFPSSTSNRSADAQLKKVDADIAQKTQYLNEYAANKNLELETMRNSMQNSDAFYKKLYAVIGKVAESGGYSAILSLQQASGVLWYSPSVDITDEVIRALNK